MKKTATLIALAGLSMAAKTEHSFLGKKPVEFPAEIDPKMVIKPAHDIDPGMVRKPTKNIDKGIFVKPKKPQATIAADDDELLLIYRPPQNVDPKMVIKPRDDIDPKMVIKPKKTQGTILTADDNDDELLSIYRPAFGYDIDPGMVRRPPYGYDIDPKMVIKPPKEFQNIDNGIFVRPQVRPATIYVDDEMRLVRGTEVDPGMVIKPKRGDIDPGMVRKPVKGWEIDPKILIKPKRGDVLYADDDEMMVRRPPSENIKYLDAENDNELGLIKDHVREPRLIGDFPTKPVYADAEDDELALSPAHVSDQGIPIKHDDELMYQRLSTAVSDLGITMRPMGGHMHARDDEFAVLGEKTKGHVREPRLIGDFYTKPWPGQPIYADAEDNELPRISDPIIPNNPKNKTRQEDDELVQMTNFVREPRIVGDHGKSADDELVYAFGRIDQGMVRRPQFENIDQGMIRRPRTDIKYLDAENDDELSLKKDHVREPRLIGDFPTKPWFGQPVYADSQDDELNLVSNPGMISVSDPIIHGGHTHDDEPLQMTEFVREPRYIEGHGKYADDADEDDEYVYAFSRIDPGMVRRPQFENIDQGMIRRPRTDIKYLDAENDDELIMFADYSLDKPRRGVIDLKELTKPWYQQQQTMYADDADNELIWAIKPSGKKNKGKVESQKINQADDADNELLWYRKATEKKSKEEKAGHKMNDLKTGKNAQKKKPEKKKPEEKEQEKVESHMIKEADDELILFADKSLDARLERRKVPIDLKELTKPWYQQQHTMYADDSLVALGELLEDN